MKNRRLQLTFIVILIVVIGIWLGFQYLPTLLGGGGEPSLQSGETREVTFMVGANMVDCNNGTTGRCLLVDGEPFNQNIGDFLPRAGCTYDLRVEEYAIYDADEAPRETSRYRYRLLEITARMCQMP